LWGLFGLGWAIVLISTFLINHFELFGLQQAWFAFRARSGAKPALHQPFFYRLVRHPLYAGFFLAFGATPAMTAGHLLLALGLSAYMLIAIRLEQRNLVDTFGADYLAYREKTPMLVPGAGRRGGQDLTADGPARRPRRHVEMEMVGVRAIIVG
jgi:protein-S-isoprenylcysteine O-methyltransferase Ste14